MHEGRVPVVDALILSREGEADLDYLWWSTILIRNQQEQSPSVSCAAQMQMPDLADPHASCVLLMDGTRLITRHRGWRTNPGLHLQSSAGRSDSLGAPSHAMPPTPQHRLR